jgi:hypothetical protein
MSNWKLPSKIKYEEEYASETKYPERKLDLMEHRATDAEYDLAKALDLIKELEQLAHHSGPTMENRVSTFLRKFK